MRLAWLAALAAACGPSSVPSVRDRPPEPAPRPVDPAPPPAPSGPALVKTTARTQRIEAPHGGAITNLAVTFDGTAAVTCDELGGVRLWPALDGTLEPRALDLPKPDELAIGRDPRGFLIAMIDGAGGLVIQVVDRDGITVQRAVLAGEPAYAGVAIAPQGLIAWRTDQRVLRFASDGSVASQLAAEPGQRIAAIAVAGDKAVALFEPSGPPQRSSPAPQRGAPPAGSPQRSAPPAGSTSARRVRWLELGATLAWGAWIDVRGPLGERPVLSPSGRRLATLVRALDSAPALVTVFDTAKGSRVAEEPAPAIVAIGLVSDDLLALGSPGGGAVTWLDLAKPRATKPKPTLPAPVPVVEAPLLGVGGGRAISAISGELMIATPAGASYLGYELESPAVAAAAPNGRILIGLGDAFALLDHKLEMTSPPDLAVPAGSAIADVRWLGGDEWLVESSRINDGITSITLVDIARKKTSVVRSGMSMVHMLMYEPSTQLVTLSLGDAPEVLRLLPGKLRLDRVAALPKPAGFERTELVPVSPALAGGTHVVAVHMRDRLTLRWLRDPAALDRGAPITIDGSLAGVDAAGHAYIWQSDAEGVLELVVYRDGKRIGAMPTEGPTAVWPDPRGTQVVQVGQRSIRLATVDGTVKWAVPVTNVSEALWLDDGTLGIVSAAGLARLDAATGNVLAVRCGWRFGLSSKQHPVSPRVEPVCTQLR